MGDNGRQPRSSRAKSSAQAGTNTADFNQISGATPVISKAQLLSQLKQCLPRFNGNQIRTIDGEELTPTKNQRYMMDCIREKSIVFVEATFGTGKTMWACYMGLLGLVEKKYNRIGLNAPAIEAGEYLGFQKGSMEEKMFHHVNQILEAFDDFIGEDLRKKLCEAGIIKIEPHAFMRGRTMKKTFFIFDECQNATGPNLQTGLTRYGYNSTFVFLGDRRQNDRTLSEAAYPAFINKFTKPVYAEHTVAVQLGAEDVKRHPFLKLVVEQGDDAPLQGHETHRASHAHKPTSAQPR